MMSKTEGQALVCNLLFGALVQRKKNQKLVLYPEMFAFTFFFF